LCVDQGFGGGKAKKWLPGKTIPRGGERKKPGYSEATGLGGGNSDLVKKKVFCLQKGRKKTARLVGGEAEN